jgi:hypothetical protein
MNKYEGREFFWEAGVVGFDSLIGYDYWLNDAEAVAAEAEGKIVPYWRVESVTEPIQVRKRRFQREVLIRHTETGEKRTVVCGKNLRYSR